MSWVLVSLIGPPAAGKTTLADRLAEDLSAKCLHEDYAGNPFLSESYVGSADARLPGQLYFLMSRAGQLSRSAMAPGQVVVSDYGFCQDAIYAAARLDGPDLAMYQAVARRVELLVQPPSLLIRLDAPADILIKRIAERGRRYETAMTAQFLDELRSRYVEICSRASCPVITIDTQAVDVRDAAQRSRIVAAVRRELCK